MLLKIRGLTTYGGVKISITTGETLKIWRARSANLHLEKELEVHQNRLYLRALGGSIELLEVQPEGKKRMAAKDFVNGYLSKVV